MIYCSLSGFGRTGPYKHRRGFDLVAQAMSGIMSFTGERPDGPPVKCGAPLSDITAGIIAAMGILAAYAHRLKTGEGQWVETSLFEAALVQTYWQAAIALATGVAPKAMGSAHPLNAPYQAFEASDDWIVVGGANQKHWLRTLEVLGATELARDPRFATGADRMATSEGAGSPAHDALPHQARRILAGCARGSGVPCGPVNDMLQALADPQTIAREMVVEVEHSTLGQRQDDRIADQVLARRPARCDRARRSTASTPARSWARTALTPTKLRRSQKEGADRRGRSLRRRRSADAKAENSKTEDNKNQIDTGGLRCLRSRNSPRSPSVSQSCCAGAANAAWQPAKPIEFIATAGPGGGTDNFARAVQNIITKYKLVEQPIVVVNKAGGSGAEGYTYAKAMAGDPYKVVFGTSNAWTAADGLQGRL